MYNSRKKYITSAGEVMHPASGVCDQWKWPTNSDEIWYFNIVQKSLYPNHFVVVEELELLAHSNLKNN